MSPPKLGDLKLKINNALLHGWRKAVEWEEHCAKNNLPASLKDASENTALYRSEIERRMDLCRTHNEPVERVIECAKHLCREHSGPEPDPIHPSALTSLRFALSRIPLNMNPTPATESGKPPATPNVSGTDLIAAATELLNRLDYETKTKRLRIDTMQSIGRLRLAMKDLPPGCTLNVSTTVEQTVTKYGPDGKQVTP